MYKRQVVGADEAAAKAAFLDYLAEEAGKITVADVTITDEDITVTFDEDALPSDVLTRCV